MFSRSVFTEKKKKRCPKLQTECVSRKTCGTVLPLINSIRLFWEVCQVHLTVSASMKTPPTPARKGWNPIQRTVIVATRPQWTQAENKENLHPWALSRCSFSLRAVDAVTAQPGWSQENLSSISSWTVFLWVSRTILVGNIFMQMEHWKSDIPKNKRGKLIQMQNNLHKMTPSCLQKNNFCVCVSTISVFAFRTGVVVCGLSRSMFFNLMSESAPLVWKGLVTLGAREILCQNETIGLRHFKQHSITDECRACVGKRGRGKSAVGRGWCCVMSCGVSNDKVFSVLCAWQGVGTVSVIVSITQKLSRRQQ